MTTTNQETPKWLTGLMKNRTPDAVRILMKLVKEGLRRGYCTANDIDEYERSHLEESNSIGAVFKVLPRFGFVQLDRRVPAAHKSQNGRKVHVWELKDATKARRYLEALAGQMVGAFEVPTDKQLRMF